MRKLLVILLILVATKIDAKTLGIAITGDLKGDANQTLNIFQGQIWATINEPAEIFTGPYTLRIMCDEENVISVEAFGLGPEYHDIRYTIKPAIGDTLSIPALPVKGDIGVIYTFALLYDTSDVISAEPPPGDTLFWGISESIHYRTHWLKNSYADYNWNIKMGYNEIVYDKYRHSFSLSLFDKIDFYFHPDRQTSAYINPKLGYAINPRIRRIDAIFGHDEFTATPRPGAELVLYRQWGYAPRWMVTGFAGYYLDYLLQMRSLGRELKADKLAGKFSDINWVDSDTGRIISGAFCKYLADTHYISNFMELYRNSTEYDFETQFKRVYKKDFKDALESFLKFAIEYKPQKGEVEFFASLYMQQGEYEKAKDYLLESGERDGLTLCLYWLGEYDEASKVLGPNPFGPNCDYILRNAGYQLAAGRFRSKEFENVCHGDPLIFYKAMIGDTYCPEARINLASIYLDYENADSSLAEIYGVNMVDVKFPEYFIVAGRSRQMKGESGDSLLATAAAMVLTRIQTQPQEPVSYLLAGQAFMYMKDFARAEENLNTAYFLDKRPYFAGCTLLELGKLMDLQGNRDEAEEYYRQIELIKAGAYQKYLAEKYLAKQFTLEPTGN